MTNSPAITPPVPRKTNPDTLILVVVLLLIAVMAASTPLDSDMWWHLRAGEETLRTGKPLLVDIFSFTRAGVAWTNHSWLAQVILFMLFNWAGFLGLGLLVCCLAVGSMALTYRQMEGPAVLKAFGLILAAVVSAPVWSPRPQLFSLLLFGLVAYLLYLYKRRQLDRLFWLVPIFVLWSNLHAGYVLGLLLIGAMIAGEVLNHLLGHQGNEVLTYWKILRLVLWAALSGLAVLINPNGIKTWLIPFQTVGVQTLQNFIDEWASPDFHQLSQQPLIWMLFGLLISAGLARRRWDGSDLVSVILFGYLALVARRNFGPFALVAGPVLSRFLWDALSAWFERVRPALEVWRVRLRIPTIENIDLSQVNPRRSRLINFSLVALLGFVMMLKLFLVTDPALVRTYEKKFYPVMALAWIEAHHPQGNMLSSYTWGGYLIDNLRDYPVFVDGRTDLYNDEIIDQWLKVVNGREGWQSVLDEWQVHTILLEPSRPVINLLPLSGWRVLYQDSAAVILGR